MVNSFILKNDEDGIDTNVNQMLSREKYFIIYHK